MDAGGETEPVRGFGESDESASARKEEVGEGGEEERGEGGRKEEIILYKERERGKERRRASEGDLFVYNILTIFYLVTIRMPIETPIE